LAAVCKEKDSNESDTGMKPSRNNSSLLGDENYSTNNTKADATSNMALSTQKGHVRSASDQNVSQADSNNSTNEMIENPQNQKEKLVLLYLDINDLSNHIRTVFFDDIVQPMLSDLDEGIKQRLKSSLDEGCDSIIMHLEPVSDSIVQNVGSKCIPHLQSVHDIQRLYRRTNRQVPSKACAYVTSVILPIQQFFTETSGICPKDILHGWCIAILSNIANEYLSVVSETLAAVQKKNP